MGYSFTSEFLNKLERQPQEKNIQNKISISLDMFKPTTIKYRIDDGQIDYDYQRETVLPSLQDTQIVLQSTYSKAGGDTGKRFLESSGAGPCVIATLYDQESKTGFMVHFDSRSNVTAALKEMKKHLGENPDKWHMRIIGGYRSEESSRRIVGEIRNSAAFSKIILVEEDILEDGYMRKSVNVVLDTESGQLFDLPLEENKRFSESQIEQLKKRIDDIMNHPRVRLGEVKFIQNILEVP